MWDFYRLFQRRRWGDKRSECFCCFLDSSGLWYLIFGVVSCPITIFRYSLVINPSILSPAGQRHRDSTRMPSSLVWLFRLYPQLPHPPLRSQVGLLSPRCKESFIPYHDTPWQAEHLLLFLSITYLALRDYFQISSTSSRKFQWWVETGYTSEHFLSSRHALLTFFLLHCNDSMLAQDTPQW